MDYSRLTYSLEDRWSRTRFPNYFSANGIRDRNSTNSDAVFLNRQQWKNRKVYMYITYIISETLQAKGHRTILIEIQYKTIISNSSVLTHV
jgi:hypothetical protein